MPTRANVDRTATQAARALVPAVSRFRRRLRAVTGTNDLTPSQLSVLSLIAKGEADTASALAAAEGVRPQSVAASLVVLEERGLIERRADPDDGRRQLVTLSRTGGAMIFDDRTARQEWLVDKIRTSLTEAERRTLIDAAELMQRLADS